MQRVAVDVVHWDLTRQHGNRDDLARLLTAEETARADRFVLPQHRARFVATRGLLRRALGAATGRDPAVLRFALGPDGKPSLIGESVEFNLSHSGDAVVLAMVRGAAVGCDVEAVRAVPQAPAIAERWFSRSECEGLAGLSGESLDRAFLSCWVRKEAALKALGTGLQSPLGFTAGFARAGGEETVVTVAGRRCWVTDLALAPGCIGAVASDRPMQVRCESR